MTDLAAPELELDSRFGAPLPHDGTKVLLITEGGYPYRFGGVSTWCRLLVGGLHDIYYSVLAITGDPDSEPIFELPPNVRSLIKVPLWGTRETHEAKPGGLVEAIAGPANKGHTQRTWRLALTTMVL